MKIIEWRLCPRQPLWLPGLHAGDPPWRLSARCPARQVDWWVEVSKLRLAAREIPETRLAFRVNTRPYALAKDLGRRSCDFRPERGRISTDSDRVGQILSNEILSCILRFGDDLRPCAHNLEGTIGMRERHVERSAPPALV